MLDDKFEDASIVELFPLPLLRVFWSQSEKLNHDIIDLILSRERLEKGITTTNVGGWHSKKDLQDWDEECVRVLVNRMSTAGREMNKRFFGADSDELLGGWRIQAWANINRFNDYNKFHTHIRNSNLWSGVYYVDEGYDNEKDTETSTRIIFADQHRVEPRNLENFKKRHSIEPKAGLMVLFPSSLGHSVERHYGSRPRITVAFNLKHDNLTTINYEIEKNDTT
jgi:uncharacterized protein (TIGR02466 family)